MKKLYFVVDIDDQTDENVAAEMILASIKGCLYVSNAAVVAKPEAIDVPGFIQFVGKEINQVQRETERYEIARFTEEMSELAKTNKIRAIKEVRDRFRWDLRTAKDFVDRL